jgi:hypothetical protein
MVHFPGFARTRLWIHRAVRGVYPRGFPHSEIPGSKPACGSPGLIAACHVLHRLLLPRHPPCALSSLTTKFARCTRASGYWFLAFSWKHEHAEKFYGPYILLIACSRLATPTPQQETIQALIKIYVRLVIAQSIQLSNIVLVDLIDSPASAGMGLTYFRPCTILKFLQPNVRRQATFYEPRYGFGCRIDAQHRVELWWS